MQKSYFIFLDLNTYIIISRQLQYQYEETQHIIICGMVNIQNSKYAT